MFRSILVFIFIHNYVVTLADGGWRFVTTRSDLDAVIGYIVSSVDVLQFYYIVSFLDALN